ncbi:Twitching mobility protein [Saezia sanguinis]|uniref:Twitching mobility protein n=1 Tax=Saezia sanguinis TaxID=1965230 RepID=A0A433SBM4_9BURK|nr:PilT/PilU family type 4a pilus ATPase [Saezia sanguinis]RUS66156.1 Twitching mobility protein [Saezia sanguinis]
MTSPKMERLMVLMAQKSASDLYLTANAPIMIRLHGNMVPVNGEQQLTADKVREMLVSVLSAEQVNELDTTGELNVGIHRDSVGNFRYSCFRQRGSLAAVIRYIPPSVPAFESLNLPPALADLALTKRGLILFVGATGCGKSTSIASLLDLRNTHLAGHILTIEDPIEYFFTNKRSIINQREIGKDTVSLNTGLKNALRQMPDCIFIGEIRDAETMSAALAYAHSGHMCVSTLHASNSYEALNRIMSFYSEDVRPILLNDMAAALKAIVSQRLLRTSEGALRPAVEIMENTRLISELITKGSFHEIRDAMEKSLAEGSQTFEEDLAYLIREKLITQAEGIENADSPSNLLWRLQNDPKRGVKKEDKKMPTFTEDDGPVFSDIELNINHS